MAQELRQNDEAAKIGISPQYWHHIQKGERRISFRVALLCEKNMGMNARKMLVTQLDKELEIARRLFEEEFAQ